MLVCPLPREPPVSHAVGWSGSEAHQQCSPEHPRAFHLQHWLSAAPPHFVSFCLKCRVALCPSPTRISSKHG